MMRERLDFIPKLFYFLLSAFYFSADLVKFNFA